MDAYKQIATAAGLASVDPSAALYALINQDGVLNSNREYDVDKYRTMLMPVFEAAFQCVLTLGSTEAIQLFAMMCISSLDFFTYSELEDALINHSKELYAKNMITYSELNKKR